MFNFNEFIMLVKKETFTNRIIILILLSYPALLLTVNGSMGVLFFLLLLTSLIFLYRMRNSLTSSHWDGNSIACSVAMASPVLAILLSQAYHGKFYAPSYDWASRFLFAIPIYLALRQVNMRVLTLLQYSLPIGALVAVVWLLLHPYIWYVGDHQILGKTTSQAFNLIHFSDTALILGFLSLFSINLIERDRLLILAFKLCGFVAGIYMSVQSGERGGWLAIPVLILVWVLVHSKERRLLKIGATVVLTLSAILLGYSFLDVVHHRIDSVFEDLNNYSKGSKDTSIGVRLQLWQAAVSLFIANPFFGVGPNEFSQAMPVFRASGLLTPYAANFGNSEVHNEILAKCAGTGLFGLLSILSVHLVPVIIFWRSTSSTITAVKIGSFMGICLVFGFFIFGLTVEIFNLKMTAAFFSLTLAVLLAMATHKGNH
jgi:O-antigen ligase